MLKDEKGLGYRHFMGEKEEYKLKIHGPGTSNIVRIRRAQELVKKDHIQDYVKKV